jgi:hypothetical protein
MSCGEPRSIAIAEKEIAMLVRQFPPPSPPPLCNTLTSPQHPPSPLPPHPSLFCPSLLHPSCHVVKSEFHMRLFHLSEAASAPEPVRADRCGAAPGEDGDGVLPTDGASAHVLFVPCCMSRSMPCSCFAPNTSDATRRPHAGAVFQGQPLRTHRAPRSA